MGTKVRHMRGFHLKEPHFGAVLTFPTLFFLFAIIVYPICTTFYISFHSMNLKEPELGTPFIGLENYYVILNDPSFLNSLMNSLIYTSLTISTELLLGLGLALLLNRDLGDRGFFRTVFLLPLMASPIVVGLMWRWLYIDQYGILNYFLKEIGIRSPPLWLADPSIALYSIIIIDIWLCTPFNMLVLLAGLQSIPKDLYEAAEIDGAPSWQKFKHISLPLLKPAILAVLLIRAMDAFKVFDFIYVLTYGGPAISTETVVFYAYKVIYKFLRMGRGAAIAVITLLIILAVGLVFIRLFREEVAR